MPASPPMSCASSRASTRPPAWPWSAAGRPSVTARQGGSEALGWVNPRYSADVKSGMAPLLPSGAAPLLGQALHQMRRRHRRVDPRIGDVDRKIDAGDRAIGVQIALDLRAPVARPVHGVHRLEDAVPGAVTHPEDEIGRAS